MNNKKSLSKNFKINEEKCIKCGLCVKDCTANAITMVDFPILNEKKCIECGHCLAVCPTGALSILGKEPFDSTPLKGNFPSSEQMKTLIKGRRSIRQYSNENLPKETIKELFDTASHAPTGVNSCSVHHTVIDDKDTMETFRNEVYTQLEGVLSKTDSDEKNSGSKHAIDMLNFAIKDRKKTGRDLIFRGAPHLVVTTAPKNAPTPAADTVIALSYLELMAQSMGIGTVWNGIAMMAFACLPELSNRLGIPEDHQLGYIMSFGKPTVKYHRTVERGSANMKTVSLK